MLWQKSGKIIKKSDRPFILKQTNRATSQNFFGGGSI
jgi:hypothetical protein